MTYDGYGRLLTRHVPEQDAGTATVYAYNTDDTVQSVTDARGAAATYTYNNRHLVTGINYSAPAGITPTSNVTVGYDAAGNRTSMTDGLGSASYNYNQLSQMTSETRTITGLGNFTIGYDYNFGGELKSITDPFNATINYGYDSAGRLSSVTGTSFAGVTTYATGAQYRAWGALKSLTYGNDRTLSASYNSRMQTTSFSGVIYKAYQYYADGSLRYSQDWVDDRFDRSYAYDHMSRVSQALSGAEARGEPPSDNRPYHQSFTYDAFNHLTSQVGQHWSQGPNSSDSSFINNRRVGSDYDADGNVLSGNAAYTYNSAGQIAVVQWGTDNTVQGFDGNGLRVKTTETTVSNGQSSTEVRYYVRSTVLGGQVVTEMSGNGTKKRTFVYAGGQVLAWQRIVEGVQRVTWEHRDPSNVSFRTTNEDGTMNGQTYVGDGAPAELDPSGANADVFDPYLLEPPPEENQGSLISYGSFGDASQLGTTYSWDGIPMPADELFQMVGQLMHGRFGIAQALMNGTRIIGTRTITAIGHDPEGTFPNIVYYHGIFPIYGTDPMAMGLLFGQPQRTPQKTSAQKTPCTFNLNLTNSSSFKVDTAAFEKELKSIFGGAGFNATTNKPGSASNASFNFNLTIYNNFPASYDQYDQTARSDPSTLGYTPSTRFFPNSSYPDIPFPGQAGGVSVNHIRASYGRASVTAAALSVIAARVGAHEFITHYLLGQPGHEGDAQGLTRTGFDYRNKGNVFISDAVKEQLNKICSTGQLPQ